MKKFITITGILSLLLTGFASQSIAAEKKTRILATTFPIYQITQNIIAGQTALVLDLMIPAQLGCPHDYALTPQDMQKLAKADLLIINGLGMEEFLGAPVEKAHPGLSIIDSSEGIPGVLRYAEEPGEEHSGRADEHPHHAEEGHEHHHEGLNPHLFASPRMSALLAVSIAEKLAAFDPDHAALYRKNAKGYTDRMTTLADAFTALGKALKNNRIVTQHGVFDYLARDMGLDIAAVVQAHAGEDPAAADMLAIVQTIREKNIGAIFTEPQYPDRIGRTLARETGIPAKTLDPAATGPEAAPRDYYEQVMCKNLTILRDTLGVR